jgi:hypothetical protein
MDLSNYTYPSSSFTPAIIAHRGAMTDLELTNYIDKVYSYLLKMPTDKNVLITSLCNDATRELFIACIKLFIDEVPSANVVFTNDFQFIRRDAIYRVSKTNVKPKTK